MRGRPDDSVVCVGCRITRLRRLVTVLRHAVLRAIKLRLWVAEVASGNDATAVLMLTGATSNSDLPSERQEADEGSR